MAFVRRSDGTRFHFQLHVPFSSYFLLPVLLSSQKYVYDIEKRIFEIAGTLLAATQAIC